MERPNRENCPVFCGSGNSSGQSNLSSEIEEWYFVTKIVLTYTVRKNCSSDREKLLKFESEGREFAKLLRLLEQFIQVVKGQINFW